jgi:hypothetical protein
MFGFLKSRKAEVLQHWIAFVEGFQLSPSEFYDRVERELKVRQVPGMEMARIEFSEGWVLSDKRVYLRMVRERLVFDVCAAPFGRSFFFSCRFAEIPAEVHLWQLAILLVSMPVLGLWVWFTLVMATRILGLLGLVMAVCTWIALPPLALYVMRNAVAMGLKDLDATLIKSPVVGSMYEKWIRRETYYRHDTRLMYLDIVESVVRNLADEAVTAKGVQLVRQYEQAPILGELYKPVTSRRDPVTPPPQPD